MKHIVGFSGGIDSQAALRYARNRYGDDNVIALNSQAGRWERQCGPLMQSDAQSLLKGLDLACSCPLDQPCHADVLLEIANSEGEC